MRTKLWIPVLVSLVIASGCGGDGNTSGGGVRPATRFLTVSVTSDVITCGKCETFTATLTTGSGATQTVTANWRTDMPSVATIDSAGSLTAIAQGDVTVIATYEELQATKLVHVVHDFGGRWYGNYSVTSCQTSGQFDGFCSPDVVAVGDTLPLFLDLEQERASVQGDLYLGQVETAFTGRIESTGELAGESKGSVTEEGVTFDFLVSPARFRKTGSRIGDGTITWTMSSPAYSGNLRVEARVMGLDPWTGDGASRQATSRPRTLRDALRARPVR
jgi:hypothetical protein